MNINIIRRLTLCMMPAFLLFPTPTRANEQVYNKLLPSTAWVVVDIGNGLASQGSGVLVDGQKKWVLTNYHVVRNKSAASVFFPVRGTDGIVTEKTHYLAQAAKL